MVIWFNSEKARNQLINEGVVITCRNHRKSFGTTQAVFTNEDRKRETIGYVDVEYLEESHNEDSDHDKIFLKYLELSGFKSVKEWKDEILRINNRLWMNVYFIFIKVTMDREIY